MNYLRKTVYNLETGDVFIKPGGQILWKVISNNSGEWLIIRRCDNTGADEDWYPDSPYQEVKVIIPYEQVKKETKVMEENQLYQVIGKEIYGYKIGVNSAGKIVFEVKGPTSEILTLDKSEITEVFPHTCAVRYSDSKEYEYLFKEGSVAVGDILVCTTSPYGNGICRVTKVGTKSREATKEFVGYKIPKGEML